VSELLGVLLKVLLRLVSFCAFILIFCALALAQAPVGSISGTVFDESGAVVPAAPVSITNKDTGLLRNVITSADGIFSASSLPAGIYEVKTEVPGFRTLVREATIVVGGQTTVDLHLQVGAQKDVVTVESVTPQIEYERHTIDGVVNRQQIQSLPLNGRSFLQLAMLEPGVTVSSNAQGQYNRAFDVSILGSDSNLTRITIDGATVRDSVTGGTQQNFSQEIVQEFQVSSVNFDLSTGVGAGGSVNVVTRSGSNQLHGSAFEFLRNKAFDATRWLTDLGEVRAVVAGAVQRGVCPIERLVEELEQGPRQGSANLRRALAEVADGVRSAAEGQLHALIRRAGLPMPMFNPRLFIGRAFLAVPDCWWPDAGVAAEVDSRAWHLSPQEWENTLARQARMAAAGIIVLHFPPSRIYAERKEVVAEIRSALAAGRGRSLPRVRTLPAR